MSNLSPRALALSQAHGPGPVDWERVAEIVSMAGWQPIEWAPRDGTVVLLYRPLAHITHDPHVTIRRTCPTPQFVWPATIPPGCSGFNYTEGSCYASHWMPLPSPPADREQSA